MPPPEGIGRVAQSLDSVNFGKYALPAALGFGHFFPTSDVMVSTLAALNLYALGYAIVRNRTHPEAMK
jgi:hypothetical protein